MKELRYLSKSYPELAAQWHPYKNGNLTPDQVTAGSSIKAWWYCSQSPDHEWEATIKSRKNGNGCPFCAGRFVSSTNSLAALFPAITVEWHPDKNGDLTPDKVVAGSELKVWWKCPGGPDHEWEAVITSRTKGGNGCPFCAGQRVSVTNSFAARFPAVAKEWHPTKNGSLTLDKVVAGSTKKVWWKCPKGPDHEWKAPINSRIRVGRKNRCPFCAGRRASITNSLANQYPDLAAQWHLTRNGDLRPNQVAAGSSIKVWWKCLKGPDHEWQAMPIARRNGFGCPYCAGRRASITNSLATQHPDLAAQWHPTRNGDRVPEQAVAGSNTKAWWKCPEGPDHEWEAVIASRTKGVGCPFCAGQRVSVTNSLATRYPALAKGWHPTKNEGLTPDRVIAGSIKKVWWKCSKGPDHEWQATVDSRTQGETGCPFCAGRRVSVTNSLATLFPDLAAEWHPTKNGDLTPDQVIAGSKTKVWWKCSKGPDHEWLSTLDNRTMGFGCPFCAGRRVSRTNSLATLFPNIAAEWHPAKNGDLTSDQVVSGSQKKVWWKCSEGPDHEWQATINSRTRGGVGCPFCAGRSVSITNSLAARFPSLAAEWHPTNNGDLTPDKVVAGSTKKVWWKCSKNPNHEWEAIIDNRARGKGCPLCWGWTLNKIRLFISSLKPYLAAMTPAELYVLFQQSGLNNTSGIGRSFIKALSTGRFPLAEVEKFIDSQPSLVDRFIEDPSKRLEEEEDQIGREGSESSIQSPAESNDDLLSLPGVETKEVLAAMASPVVSSADGEAAEFLVESAVSKIWKHAFKDEEAAVAQAQAFQGEGYAEQVASRFLAEYRQAKELQIPTGYRFSADGHGVTPPKSYATIVRYTCSRATACGQLVGHRGWKNPCGCPGHAHHRLVLNYRVLPQ